MIFESSSYIHIKITDANKARWEIPQSLIKRPVATQRAVNELYAFTYTASPFTFEVTRKSDGRSLFKSLSQMYYKDQFIQLATSIDSSATTFGIGESARLTQALQPGHTATLWARDQPAVTKNVNLYGSYPMYLQMVAGAAHGALLLNSVITCTRLQNLFLLSE